MGGIQWNTGKNGLKWQCLHMGKRYGWDTMEHR